jgi:hypothetical protein
MIEIVYPGQRLVPYKVVEQWFVHAVRNNQIPPGQLAAKTPQDMARALESIGWIRLASK